MRDNIERLAYEIALASLEAEPVLYQSCTRPTWNSGVPWTNGRTEVVGATKTICALQTRLTMPVDIQMSKTIYHSRQPPIALEAIENAIEYIRSIAFTSMKTITTANILRISCNAHWPGCGHSCSDDRLDKADNQPASGNRAAESNRGNEWTGNPDIDNAIIMLDRRYAGKLR